MTNLLSKTVRIVLASRFIVRRTIQGSKRPLDRAMQLPIFLLLILVSHVPVSQGSVLDVDNDFDVDQFFADSIVIDGDVNYFSSITPDWPTEF